MTRPTTPRPSRWWLPAGGLGLLMAVAVFCYVHNFASPTVAAKVAGPVAAGPAKGTVSNQGQPSGIQPTDTTTPKTPDPVRDVKPVANGKPDDGGETRKLILWGGLGAFVVVTVFLFVWLPRKRESNRDSRAFTDALVANEDRIWSRCENSPREVRRFLNYLRLLAASSTVNPSTLSKLWTWLQQQMAVLRARQTGPLPIPLHSEEKRLRDWYRHGFESRLVSLAVDPTNAIAEPDVRDYYVEQCRLLGLDPATFRPVGE